MVACRLRKGMEGFHVPKATVSYYYVQYSRCLYIQNRTSGQYRRGVVENDVYIKHTFRDKTVQCMSGSFAGSPLTKKWSSIHTGPWRVLSGRHALPPALDLLTGEGSAIADPSCDGQRASLPLPDPFCSSSTIAFFHRAKFSPILFDSVDVPFFFPPAFPWV